MKLKIKHISILLLLPIFLLTGCVNNFNKNFEKIKFEIEGYVLEDGEDIFCPDENFNEIESNIWEISFANEVYTMSKKYEIQKVDSFIIERQSDNAVRTINRDLLLTNDAYINMTKVWDESYPTNRTDSPDLQWIKVYDDLFFIICGGETGISAVGRFPIIVFKYDFDNNVLQYVAFSKDFNKRDLKIVKVEVDEEIGCIA